MKLLFAIAISNHDSALAEKLLDHIHHACGRKGTLLLAFHANLHDEMKSRLRISANLAFESVIEMAIRPLADINAPKVPQTNNVFRQVAEYVRGAFNWPFMWLEADCTPVVPDWREKIAATYFDQPFKFFGTQMKMNPRTENAPEIFFMARVGIYPPDVAGDLIPSELFVPIEISSGKTIQPRMGKTKIFQNLNIKSDDDLISVRDDAILIHGDKGSFLLNSLKEQEPIAEPVKIEVETPVVPRMTRRMMREMNGAK